MKDRHTHNKKQQKLSFGKAAAKSGPAKDALLSATAPGKLDKVEVVAEPTAKINSFSATNLDTALNNFKLETADKRRRLSKAVCPAESRSTRRRISQEEENEAPGTATQTTDLLDSKVLSVNMSRGDDSAAKYIDQLRQLSGPDAAPLREQVVHLILIMRAHNLHGCRDISAKAYRLLQMLVTNHPTSSIEMHTAETGSLGIPFVRSRDDTWTLLTSRLSKEAGDVEQEQPPVLPFDLLKHLIAVARAAATGDLQASMDWGELLLLKFVTSELHTDLRCRLQVFNNRRRGCVARNGLLENSQLWRLFNRANGFQTADGKDLIEALAAVIAANTEPAETLATGVRTPGGAAFNAGELAQLAALLLNMLLDLHGAAEDAGLHSLKGPNRASTTGALNLRAELDRHLKELLQAKTGVLGTTRQKRALLRSLRPVHGLRLLTMEVLISRDTAQIIAIGRVERAADSKRYPSLSRLTAWHKTSGAHCAYEGTDVAECLQYIADDLSSYAYRLMHTDNADDLALLVTELALAALLSGGQASWAPQLVDVGQQMLQESRDKGSKKALTPVSMVALAAAQHVVSASA